MALNLGVKPQKPAVAGPAPSMEELFDAYMDFESVVRATELFLQKGQQVEDAFENLCIVGSALKKHASAEGLATVKDIVRDELGVEVSVEAFKEKAKNALEAIKEFFKKIGVWIQEFFAKIFNAVIRAEKRIDNAIAKVKDLPVDAKLEWKYKGVYLPMAPKTAEEAVTKMKAYVDAAGNLEEKLEWNTNHFNDLASSEVEVSGKQATLKALESAKALAALIPKFKKGIVDAFEETKKTMTSTTDPQVAKNCEKRIKAAVAMTNKRCSAYARTIMSVVVHVPTKPTKEK